MTNLWRHTIGDKVLQQVTVVVTQNIFHHAQDVDGGIREVLEPVLAPVHWNKSKKTLILSITPVKKYMTSKPHKSDKLKGKETGILKAARTLFFLDYLLLLFCNNLSVSK